VKSPSLFFASFPVLGSFRIFGYESQILKVDVAYALLRAASRLVSMPVPRSMSGLSHSFARFAPLRKSAFAFLSLPSNQEVLGFVLYFRVGVLGSGTSFRKFEPNFSTSEANEPCFTKYAKW
jgi:hypothetical protein